MSWTRYLLHDFFTASEFNNMEDRLQTMRRSSSRSNAELRDRVDELEDDLARSSLVIHALSELCIRKGLVSEQELNEVIHEVDARDGKADGKVGERSRPRRTPEGYLRELEQRDRSD